MLVGAAQDFYISGAYLPTIISSGRWLKTEIAIRYAEDALMQ